MDLCWTECTSRSSIKTEIINTAEHLNTKFKEDQFVKIITVHESTQPNMNSILKSTAKIIEEVNKLNRINHAKQDGMQHTKGRLG